MAFQKEEHHERWTYVISLSPLREEAKKIRTFYGRTLVENLTMAFVVKQNQTSISISVKLKAMDLIQYNFTSFLKAFS